MFILITKTKGTGGRSWRGVWSKRRDRGSLARLLVLGARRRSIGIVGSTKRTAGMLAKEMEIRLLMSRAALFSSRMRRGRNRRRGNPRPDRGGLTAFLQQRRRALFHHNNARIAPKHPKLAYIMPSCHFLFEVRVYCTRPFRPSLPPLDASS